MDRLFGLLAISSKERLRRFANIIYEEHVEMFEEDMDVQLGELQKELANKLNICLYEDVVNKVLIKLFDVANRKPGMTVTYTEKEGRKNRIVWLCIFLKLQELPAREKDWKHGSRNMVTI